MITSRKSGLVQGAFPSLVSTGLKSHAAGIVDYNSDQGVTAVTAGEYVLTQASYGGGGIAERVYKALKTRSYELGLEDYSVESNWELQRVAADKDHDSGDGSTAVVTGEYVLTAAAYGNGGIAERVYKYLGDDDTIDLSAEDYSVTANWELQAVAAGKDHDTTDGARTVKLNQFVLCVDGFNGGGTAGRVYKRIAATGSVNLGAEDYSNVSNWTIQAATFSNATEAARALEPATHDKFSINDQNHVSTL